MPILLTTPETISGGHGQADKTYGYVRICAFHFLIDGARLVIELQYGDLVGGKWISDAPVFKLPPVKDCAAEMTDGVDAAGGWISVEAVPATTQFSDMLRDFSINAGDTGERGYDVVAKFLYNWLIDEGHYVGAIV